MEHAKTTNSCRNNCAGLQANIAETGRKTCLAGIPHEQPLLMRTLGRLVMHCYILAFCVLDCQLNDCLKAQMRENSYHANSTIGCTSCSKGNKLMDSWFGAVLKRPIQRPASSPVLGQFQGHLLCVPEGCCGKLYPLIVLLMLNS